MLKKSENTVYFDSSLLKREERTKPHAWGKRNWFQLGVFLVTIGIGFQFFIYVHQASGNGIVTVVRPPGVEDFLPIGALMGLLALCSPTRIQRDPHTCIGCKSCSQACPYYLPVDRKRYILSPECNGCMECTRVCPVESTLELKTAGTGVSGWGTVKLGTVIIGIFIGMVYVAGITGHWKSSVTENEFRVKLRTINSPEFTHPTVRFK